MLFQVSNALHDASAAVLSRAHPQDRALCDDDEACAIEERIERLGGAPRERLVGS